MRVWKKFSNATSIIYDAKKDDWRLTKEAKKQDRQEFLAISVIFLVPGILLIWFGGHITILLYLGLALIVLGIILMGGLPF